MERDPNLKWVGPGPEPSPGSGITIIDLDAIDAVANAASPGPWRAPHDPEAHVQANVITDDGQHVCDAYDNTEWSGDQCRANAEFIATARTVIPALVGYARQLESGAPSEQLIIEVTAAAQGAIVDQNKQLRLLLTEICDEWRKFQGPHAVDAWDNLRTRLAAFGLPTPPAAPPEDLT